MKVRDVYWSVYGSVVEKDTHYTTYTRWELLAQFISLDALKQSMSREDDYPRTRDYRIVRCEVVSDSPNGTVE